MLFLTVRPLKNRNRGPSFQEPDISFITERSMSLKNFYRLIFMSIISNITELISDPPATSLVKQRDHVAGFSLIWPFSISSSGDKGINEVQPFIISLFSVVKFSQITKKCRFFLLST